MFLSSVLMAEIPSVFRNSPSAQKRKGMIASLSSPWISERVSPKKMKPSARKPVSSANEQVDLLTEKQVCKSIYLARYELRQIDKLYSPGISNSYFLTRNKLIRRLKKLISIQEQINKQRQTPESLL